MKSYNHNVDYLIRKRETLSIRDRLTLLYRIALGMCFMGSHNIIHRDLKPHNIVINTALTPHIIDFGSCCSVFNNGNVGFVPFDKRCNYFFYDSADDKTDSHPISLTSS